MIHSSFACRRPRLRAPWLRWAGMTLLLAMTCGAIAHAQTEGGTSHMQGWLGVDLVRLIVSADMIGKTSLVVLVGFSIMSWMVIVYKFLHLRQATVQTDQFVEVCNQGSGDLNEAFRMTGSFPDSPLAQILREGYLELEVEDWYRTGYDLSPDTRMELAKVGIERVFERTISSEISHLESKLILLATTSNVCPFIGLFGTVWGIMGSFQALSSTGTAALSSLAPGISTALLTTVGGLFCAIPASIMYNYLTHRVRRLVSRMDAFALELSNVIQKQIIKQNATTGSGVN